jgi:ectoine hydroxylase-related dioxygenase (phytanoyl-CoA dioxygenase family)
MPRRQLLTSASLPVFAAGSSVLSQSKEQQQYAQLHREGYVIIRKALPPAMTRQARLEILQLLEEAKQTAQYHLGRALFVVNKPRCRYEVLLDTSPTIASAVQRILEQSGQIYSTAVTADAVMTELGAIISEPGARSQDIHTDIPWSDTRLYTTFVALQDVTEEMGPTRIYPRTHTKEFHAKVEACTEQSLWALFSERWRTSSGVEAAEICELLCKVVDGLLPRSAELLLPSWLVLEDSAPPFPFSEMQPESMLLREGDMVVFDTRVYHAGGANRRRNPASNAGLDKRVLLQFSFLAPDVVTGKLELGKAFTNLNPALERRGLIGISEMEANPGLGTTRE